MESVKGNSDRKQNVQMRRLIDDPQSREQPLKILEEKISVFEKPEHAQIHANARDQPATSCMLIFGFGQLTAKPEIHRSGPKQESSEGRVPSAIKNVAGYDEQIFPRLPRFNTPVKSDDDYEENDERERIKEHGEADRITLWRAPRILVEPYRGRCLEDLGRSNKIDPPVVFNLSTSIARPRHFS
jgi:hypothetical protein